MVAAEVPSDSGFQMTIWNPFFYPQPLLYSGNTLSKAALRDVALWLRTGVQITAL